MTYVIFYSVVQGRAGDYSEMCAAVVASVFAALIAVRTVWGLWQLHEFHTWATRSIDALKSMGIEYKPLRLRSAQKEWAHASIKSADVADEIVVNEKIVDNQIMHGDVQCFVRFGDMVVLKSEESVRPSLITSRVLRILCDIAEATLEPSWMGLRWVLMPLVVVLECFLVLVGRKSERRLRQVPKTPSEVWVRWAATFASQGLQKWMSEFDVAMDPKALSHANGNKNETGIERLNKRRNYFGAELLGSAAMQLWWESGDGEKGISPMLWGTWDEGSAMRDGRLVKQELLGEAMKNGECLPFGAEDLQWTRREGEEAGGNKWYGYDAYKEVLGEFISELPVQSSHVREMRKFDINMLEWLTIILHLGNMCCKMKMKLSKDGSGSKEEMEDVNDGESASRFEPNGQHANKGNELVGQTGKEALKVLCAQLGIGKRSRTESINMLGGGSSREHELPLSNIPMMGDVISLVSEGNRLVCKVGELVDVWMSLVFGDQLVFLVEELNHEWEKLCLGREVCESDMRDEGQREGRSLDVSNIHDIHKEIEKRRLRGRVADDNGGRYEYAEECVTFMGYRMEIVRTVIGRWVEANKGKCGNDFFAGINKEMMKNVKIDVELSEEVGSFLRFWGTNGVLPGHGVHCRVVWEVQNKLERRLIRFRKWRDGRERLEMGVSTIMLLLLSFPGLRFEVGEFDEIRVLEEKKDWTCIDVGCTEEEACCCGDGVRRIEVEHEHHIEERVCHKNAEKGRIRSEMSIHDVWVMCGPQKMGVRFELERRGRCGLRVLNGDGEEFKWVWWRDAFMGRLAGMEEWQNDIGIDGVVVDRWEDRNAGRDLMIREISSRLGKMRTWSEWRPFRTMFCRFELESEGLLKQPTRDRPRRTQYFAAKEDMELDVSELAMQRVKSVSYEEVEDKLLGHYCEVVREEVNGEGFDKIERNKSHHEEGMTSRLNLSHQLMHHRVAALSDGDARGLSCFIEISCGPEKEQRRVSEAIDVLCSFVGNLFCSESNAVKLTNGREGQVEGVVLPECEKLLRMVSGNEVRVERLLQVLVTCLSVDPGKHERKVMGLMQLMVSIFKGTHAELHCMAFIGRGMLYLWSKVLDEEFRGCRKENMKATVKILERLTRYAHLYTLQKPEREKLGTKGMKMFEKVLYKIGLHFERPEDERIRLAEESQISLLQVCAQAMNDLGLLLEFGKVENRKHGKSKDSRTSLLEHGTDDVAANKKQAAELYERAIKEGNIDAMENLARMLLEGAEGVPRNVERAVMLYEHAIEEGNHTRAMNNLAWMLQNGTKGIAKNVGRAVMLYERAIAGNDTSAMANLGYMLEYGSEGVPRNIERAAMLYERAIEEGNHTRAMNNLACMLENGSDGVAKDVKRAVMLYERAIDEGNDTFAMYNLAWLLENGAEGVPKDDERAAMLYERAIEEGNDARAMSNLAFMLGEGSEGVPKAFQRIRRER